MERLTVGFLSGLAAGVIVGVISLTLYLTGLCELCLVAIGGGIFQSHILPETAGLGWLILGVIDHLILSASLGIAMALILTRFGDNLAILKGAFFGSVVWYLLIGIFSPLSGYLPEAPDLAALFILLGYHVAFGGLVAYLIVKYSKTKTAA